MFFAKKPKVCCGVRRRGGRSAGSRNDAIAYEFNTVVGGRCPLRYTSVNTDDDGGDCMGPSAHNAHLYETTCDLVTSGNLIALAVFVCLGIWTTVVILRRGRATEFSNDCNLATIGFFARNSSRYSRTRCT
jgi:hypothetical protein